ncbi:MAG TPA: biotin/lipoyl-containing protein, partial [Rhizomicrobium sp.]|nr:biotin/lipoyl-containing protein [Rhizomicrobium sp.]
PAAAPTAAAPSPGPTAGAVPSPMVGTVYLSPEPGKPAFITVGKSVKEGETLFIVEAMKTMNAITAPKGGTVTEIHVADGTPVEFGQTLCVIA